MKNTLKKILMMLLMAYTMPVSAQLFDEAPVQQHRFTHVDLPKLRKVVLNHLQKDDLIENKKSQVFLFLKEDGIYFNRVKLSEELNTRYAEMFAAFDLGKGPNRVLLINKDCTAVGDFYDESFSGKSLGRLSLPETRKAMEALE